MAFFVLLIWKEAPVWTDAAASPTSLHLPGPLKGRVSQHSAFTGRRWYQDGAATAYEEIPAGWGCYCTGLTCCRCGGDFKSVKKRQQLTDGDHLQVTRCKEGRSLQAVETWRVARPHCPAGRGQSQPELFENGWLTVELSHCGAAMSWFREGRRKAESASAIKVLCKIKEPALALRTMQTVPLRWCISNRFRAASCTGSS